MPRYTKCFQCISVCITLLLATKEMLFVFSLRLLNQQEVHDCLHSVFPCPINLSPLFTIGSCVDGPTSRMLVPVQ